MTDAIDEDEQPSKAKADISGPEDPSGTLSNEKLLVDIWKQTVDTQKHFNDMCVKSRQLGLTFVAAALGAALYLFIRSPTGLTDTDSAASNAATKTVSAYSLTIWTYPIVIHVSIAIVLAAIAAVAAVRRLDLGIYHSMLRGAVAFGEDLENKHIRPLVGLRNGLTQSISHFSRHTDASVKVGSDTRYEYFGGNQKSAGDKLAEFYSFVSGFLWLAIVVIFVASNFMKAIG